MPPRKTFRSFAIYILIVILISESPVSAFTLGKTRTTTLKPADLDLSAEGSALLEVQSVLSKLDNERGFTKFGTRKSSIRNSANVLGADTKFASVGTIPIQSTTVKLPNENNDFTTQSELITTRKDKETTARINFEAGQKYKVRNESTTNEAMKQNISSEVATVFSTELNVRDREDDKSQNVTDSDYSSTTSEDLDSSDIDETQTTDFTTTDQSTEDTSTVPSGHDEQSTTVRKTVKEETTTDEEAAKAETTTDTEAVEEGTTTDTETDKEETTSETKTVKEETTTEAEATKKDIIITNKITKISTTPQTDTTTLHTDYTTLSGIEKESTAGDATTLTETMVGEFSSSSSQDPSWKKYTVIERKRTNLTTEADSSTTEMSEELVKAESVSSKVTLENTVSTSTPQEPRELASKSNSSDAEDVNLSSTLPAFNNAPETRTEQLPSTRPIDAETTTEVRIRESLASRRAGYLDLSAKQEADEETTTELFDDGKFNETDLIGFEVESQDNEESEPKNPAHKAQGQLTEDAIKEELLKEALLSDNEENSKRYSEERQDSNKVKPLDSTLDESLSVKPISKGAFYTSRSNYKPMKKIEVQSLKPYVRDPDDNSWRNESLSYLGIVFKAKNASKPFTQVLKNKTEAELNNWSEKENKNEVPDLRERLEKIAEVRKSKKKKLNQFGEMVYNDYEAENSGETSSTPKPEVISMPLIDLFGGPPTTASSRTEATQRTTTPEVYMYKEETVTTTKTPKKLNKFDYYDTNEEDDADYLNLSKIDLKKFTTRLFEKQTMTTPQPMTVLTKLMTTMLPERRPTVQYFPPREPQKVNVNDYDNDFQRKVNMFSYSESPKSSPVPETVPPATMEYKPMQYLKETSPKPGAEHQYKPGNLAKNVYVTFPPRVVDHKHRYPASNDESFNRASYIIKHYKDLIDAAVKDDYDKSAEIMPYTEAPLAGFTMKDKNHIKTNMDDDYDYETIIRKDILNRFVDNFNQNSERFKVDFPILYNSSVVHMQADEGGRVVASSSAFLKRQYGAAPAPAQPCCDMKVELSPAYELHYYVPEQEEKEEAEKSPTMPFNYRL